MIAKIILYDKMYVQLSTITEEHADEIRKKLVLRNPTYDYYKKAGYSTAKISKNFFVYETADDFLIFPIGAFDEIVTYLKWHDYEIDITDSREPGKAIDFNFDDTVTIDEHQHEIVETMKTAVNHTGLIQSPPGSGKTFSALLFISMIKLNTLVVVHERRLLNQWIQEIERRGSGNFTVGKFNAEDGHNFGDITLVLIQSGSKYITTDPRFKEYGCIIVDECLDPETIITTPSGIKRLKEIKEGDLVTTPRGAAKVKKVWKTVKPAYKYTTSNGNFLIASENHLVPTFPGNGRSLKIQEISKVGNLLIPKTISHRLAYNKEEYLLGWFLGDGTCDKKTVKFSFRTRKKELESIFLDELAAWFKPKTYLNKRGDFTFYMSREKGLSFISKYNIKSGDKTNHVEIPDNLYRSASVGVIKGLFDAEGSRTHNRIVLDMTSQRCVYQLSDMLTHHGVWNTVTGLNKTGASRSNPKHHQKFRICIYGEYINSFNKLIGFNLSSKNVPHKSNVASRSHYKSQKIKSSEYVGTRELIDIELDDEDRLFIANGFAVHNCHHSAAETYSKFLNGLPAKYKFGVSGTLKRKDGLGFLMTKFIGAKLLDIPASAVKGRVTDFTVDFINTDLRFELPMRRVKPSQESVDSNTRDKTKVNYVEIDFLLTGFRGADHYNEKFKKSELTKEEKETESLKDGWEGTAGQRNTMVIEQTIKDIQNGHRVLLLTKRKYHAIFIHRILEEKGYKGVLMTSGKPEDVSIETLRDGLDAITFISATEKIAAEGLDITDLSCIHLLVPNTNEEKLNQCIGRIRRVKEGKIHPVVRDYVDGEDNNPFQEDYFEQSARKRSKFYAKWKSEYFTVA